MKAYLRLRGVNPEWWSKPSKDCIAAVRGYGTDRWGYYYDYKPVTGGEIVVELEDTYFSYPLGMETKVRNDITRSIYEFVIRTGNLPSYTGEGR